MTRVRPSVKPWTLLLCLLLPFGAFIPTPAHLPLILGAQVFNGRIDSLLAQIVEGDATNVTTDPENQSVRELDLAWMNRILPEVQVRRLDGKEFEPSVIPCGLCKVVVGHLQNILLNNLTMDVTSEVAVGICKVTNLQTDRVCEQLIPTMSSWLLTVIANSAFAPDRLCENIHFCPDSGFVQPEIITMPDRVSPPVPVEPSKSDDERLWVVHFSDWHLDDEYGEGYDALCGEPVCCRPPNKFGEEATRPAGKFGDDNCDSSRALVLSMLEYLPTAVPKIDYIVSTGDLVPHDIWAVTQESNLEQTGDVSDIWKEHFKSVPFFPVIGNHESVPANSFPTSSIKIASVDWLYSALSEQWDGLLSEESLESIKRTGWYFARLPDENLKVIGLNTNFWYKLNWWLLMRPEEEWDPESQLTIVVNELADSEQRGEKVWILGHMSPSEIDAFPSFSRYWNQIVTRYSDTIVGQFYGHAHWDEFHVFYDGKLETSDGVVRDPPPVGVGYLAPSVTSYKNMNPAFRVYEINKRTKEVLNHYTHSVDLREGNSRGSLEWKLLYDAKSAYGLKDLSAQSWHDLSERFLSNSTLFSNFASLASRNHYLNKYPICYWYEKPFECRDRIVCKLRGTNKRNGGPYSPDEKCKRYEWVPDLPEDITENVGNASNNRHNEPVNWDRNVGVSLDIGKFFNSISAGTPPSAIEEAGGTNAEDKGLKIVGIPNILLNWIFGLLVGGDDALCR